MFRRIRQVTIVFVLAFLASIAILAMPGCSLSFSYDLEITVRQTSDGREVEAVEIKLEGEHVRHRQDSPLTDKTGRLSFTFDVSDSAFRPEGVLPKWRLVLSKDGYHDEVVDVSPRRAPKSKEVRQMIITAYMRPKK